MSAKVRFLKSIGEYSDRKPNPSLAPIVNDALNLLHKRRCQINSTIRELEYRLRISESSVEPSNV